MTEFIHGEGDWTASDTGSGGSPVEPPMENGAQDDPVAAVCNPVDPLVGTILDNRFEIEEVLGTGGAGVVYKAKQLRVNRHVAIKTIRVSVDNDVIRERFQREISSLCALNHPNIVTVYDCIFGYGDQPYVVMDYLKGLALDALLKRDGAMDLNKFARISLQIISALDHAHKKGIVHRDLKPGNIVLIDDDDSDIVKVVDFGLAKLTHDRSLTKTGELWGSPPYMSPEQAQGEPSDTRSDIYSLGAVMYEMLTGKDPFFEVVSVYELIQAHVLTPPPKFSEHELACPVPFAVEDTILKCLEKKPEDRFQTVADLQSSLVEALSGQLQGASRDYLLRFATRNISGTQGESRNNQVDNNSRGDLIITQKDPQKALASTFSSLAALKQASQPQPQQSQQYQQQQQQQPNNPPPPPVSHVSRSHPVAMNSRFQSQPGPGRWIPWTIAACSLLLALSLGVVVWYLLDRTGAVGPAKPSTAIAGEKQTEKTGTASVEQPSDSETVEPSSPHTVSSKPADDSSKSAVASNKPAPSVVRKREGVSDGSPGHSASSSRKKPHAHASTAKVSSPAHSTPGKAAAKPSAKFDPWKDLSQMRK